MTAGEGKDMFRSHWVWILFGLCLMLGNACGGSRGGGTAGGLLPPATGNEDVVASDSDAMLPDAGVDGEQSNSDTSFVPTADVDDTSKSCTDECKVDSTLCAGDAIRLCGDYDDDPCSEWGPEVACQAGQFCSDGQCGDPCTDECTAGTQECQQNASRTCGEYDGDPCAEWSPLTECGNNSLCTDGACQCVDECPTNGITECVGDDQHKTCGDFDGDLCLEWSSAEACPQDGTCEAGACVALPVCDDPDDDGYGTGCPLGPDCNEGNPDQNVVDCEGKACGDDGCGGVCGECGVEDGVSFVCSGGQCTPPTVLINEIVYDAVGSDAKGVFIELKGPPNTVLDGLKISGINGNGGKPYTSFLLWGTISATGYFVIAHTDSEVDAPVDQFSGSADLQNGPDSIHLTAGELILDAVAYGVFDGDNIASGEGNPAPGVTMDSGLAIARIPDGHDTGDNAADFQVTQPTPGAANLP